MVLVRRVEERRSFSYINLSPYFIKGRGTKGEGYPKTSRQPTGISGGRKYRGEQEHGTINKRATTEDNDGSRLEMCPEFEKYVRNETNNIKRLMFQAEKS